MLEVLQTILVTVATLAILVAIHEFGHFWVARRCGIKVLRFSVGFGKPLLKWTDRSGTEYVLAGIPLGGYVKMLDEREGPVADHELDQAFSRASPAKRIAIAAAGPVANLILAVLVYWAVFLNGVNGVAPIIDTVVPGSLAEQAGLQTGQEIVAVDGEETPTWEALQMQLLERIGEQGKLAFAVKPKGSDNVQHTEVQLERWMSDVDEPNPLKELGVQLYVPKVEAQVDEVVAGGAAERAGMQSGDLVVSVDGQPMADWAEWVDLVRSSPGVEMILLVERGDALVSLRFTPDRKLDEEGKAFGFAGVSAVMPEWPESMRRTVDYGIFSGFSAAVAKTYKMSAFTLESIKKMITGLLSPKNLSGPITIAKVASSSAQYGVFAWLSFLALLSVSLAVLNLLPVPVLDGGHIVYALIEWGSGKPVTEKVQALANQVGLLLVVCLMVFALYNDVLRL
ncbi:RIP metalloprotease RseP [Spongiibacter sp. IMCC21906]|uniref:RIP metalloprotease RseP n=1 Tax=Spongiibacter sp. IMCC21906 TaxID=1620392 RepID=UPI00062DD317|nr:RIP metalloprotease RseP [Spongiibacter sp. IMCC21906]AKH70281.1 RIP metalloprotease RseP [Spongiibacter sp. IMCC21906]